MLTNPYLIACYGGIAIFLFIIGIAAVQYDAQNKRTVSGKKKPNDWLFHDFDRKFYDALFGEKDPDDIIRQFGISPEEYYDSCRLVGVDPKPHNLASHCVYGLIALLACLVTSVFTNVYFMILGIILFVFSISIEKYMLNRKANNLRFQVQSELPGFLDLLSAELDIGLPIEQGIRILSKKLNNQLSKEFLDAMNQSELGADNWLSVLEDIAMKYNIDTFNDFVSKVSIAYSKGVSVADTVRMEAKDIKQSHVLLVRERAGKMTNSILIPITLLQFVPLLVFIMLPALVQIQGF